MLTRNDATVENALDLVEIARGLGVRHIGFKDVGAEAPMLSRLTAAIRAAGATHGWKSWRPRARLNCARSRLVATSASIC